MNDKIFKVLLTFLLLIGVTTRLSASSFKLENPVVDVVTLTVDNTEGHEILGWWKASFSLDSGVEIGGLTYRSKYRENMSHPSYSGLTLNFDLVASVTELLQVDDRRVYASFKNNYDQLQIEIDQFILDNNLNIALFEDWTEDQTETYSLFKADQKIIEGHINDLFNSNIEYELIVQNKDGAFGSIIFSSLEDLRSTKEYSVELIQYYEYPEYYLSPRAGEGNDLYDRWQMSLLTDIIKIEVEDFYISHNGKSQQLLASSENNDEGGYGAVNLEGSYKDQQAVLDGKLLDEFNSLRETRNNIENRMQSIFDEYGRYWESPEYPYEVEKELEVLEVELKQVCDELLVFNNTNFEYTLKLRMDEKISTIKVSSMYNLMYSEFGLIFLDPDTEIDTETDTDVDGENIPLTPLEPSKPIEGGDSAGGTDGGADKGDEKLPISPEKNPSNQERPVLPNTGVNQTNRLTIVGTLFLIMGIVLLNRNRKTIK